jgi:Ca2+-binding RTX toxin-like protein
MKIQGAGESQYQSNDPIVIGGGQGDDKIHVTPNEIGGVDVTVTNEAGQSRSYCLTAEEAERLVICGGGGNDKIKVDPGVKQEITVRGGKGNDIISNGCGDTFVYSENGNDWISSSTRRNKDDESVDSPAMWDVKSNHAV